MAGVPSGFKPAKFNGGFLEQNGPFYVREQGDVWQVGLMVDASHSNYIGIVHGGVLSTLADVALSMQPFMREQAKLPVTTTTLTINFLAPAREGDWLVAECRIDRAGYRTSHVSGSICREDETLATMSGVFNTKRS
jgi:acyl-coenzyme A thioesterase 13